MKSRYYDEDVFSYIDHSILLNPYFEEWYEYVRVVLISDEFQKRKLFPHHHNMSVWEHSILVSFRSFVLAKALKADDRVCAIAGLLHDFYPWSWMYSEALEHIDDGIFLKETKTKHSLFRKHGFTHAKAAAENYVKFFPELENEVITDSIKRHMFPLNIVPPKYKEGFIITMVDKIDSVYELPSPTVISSKIARDFNDKIVARALDKIRG